MDEVFYPPRAEATVIDPAELEKMLAAATPRCLVWPPVSMLPKEEQAQIMREAAAIQFPWLSSAQPAIDNDPDQRGFIIGGERL